jgi:hypothetical protein
MLCCNAIHCAEPAAPGSGMCNAHWQMVPRVTQARIQLAAQSFQAFGPVAAGAEFLMAWADAIEHVAAQEGAPSRNAFRRLASALLRQELEKRALPRTTVRQDPATHREGSCDGKAQYPDYNAAARAMRGLLRHGSGDHARLTPYRCIHCSKWHFGNRYHGSKA